MTWRGPGEAVDLAPRTVVIERFDALRLPDRRSCRISRSTCGKGTYVRALARDMARALGTVGHVAALRRTAVGPFGEADMISLEKLAECAIRRPAITPWKGFSAPSRPCWTASRHWP